ncbi:hypothetical protein SORBI_3007G187300 [Sorghum bicolor]|uniref:Uncharacterized protein n=1 Tax=Sorghum bicolor TaxID=4558 RepID=C5YHL5_SORBI|nr:hypothetical protein SORBI_3007G187300 [Sorghum bicolor]
MKSIGKAAELVSKAVGALRRKAGVLRARLLFLMASPRRRAAVLAGISRHIRALTTTTPRQPCHEKAAPAAQHYCRDAACRPLAPADDDDDDDDEGVVVAAGGLPVVAPASSLLLLLVVQAEGDGDDGDGGCTADWTLALRSLFDDEVDGHGRGGGDDCLAAAMDGLVVVDDDETSSVLDVIRRRREGDGQEFRIEDEIDRAAGMYITRVRRRMSAQLLKMTSY